jgi:hypothetical protein
LRDSSCQVVPWPGSSGILTAKPASAKDWAHERRLCGLPVNPWDRAMPMDGPSPEKALLNGL